MLTIQIEDSGLEERLLKRAEAVGTSVQQLVRDLVVGQLGNPDELGFEIPRLDVRAHARSYAPELSAEEREALEKNPDVKPFSHVTDTVAFARQLRKNAWQ